MLNRRQFTFAAAALMACAAPSAGAAEAVKVFAAASLKTALDAAGAAWTAETGKAVKASYAASPALARQIAQGAPADVFFSADRDWMDYLAQQGLIDRASITGLLGNEMVLIAPAENGATVEIAPGFDLAALLAGGRLAMADVKSVPAGKYGKASLEALGVWNAVKGRIAQAENVRAALKLVATGEAPLGIVYRTDAKAEPAVRVIATFPAATHPPIIYPLARVTASQNPDAADFIAFLTSSRAAAIFVAHGFRVLK